jgi:hypothetical protein
MTGGPVRLVMGSDPQDLTPLFIFYLFFFTSLRTTCLLRFAWTYVSTGAVLSAGDRLH